MNRKWYILIMLLAIAAVYFFPKNISQSDTPSDGNASVSNLSKIRIASFNIQVFGESKRSKPEVISVLARTVRKFDIVAIQELRDDTETTLPYFVNYINTFPGPEYAAISSPRLGRTSSKENYAFIYNTETVDFVLGSNRTFQDPPSGTSTDLFQREPFMAAFKSGNLSFVLIVIHTEPDTTESELDSMKLVFSDAASAFPETKLITLGDMNADCDYLKPGEPAWLREDYFWVVPDGADTTTKSTDCAYDRIILNQEAKKSFDGAWGVYRFDNEFSLNASQSEAVSDHYPVWAEFNTG
jgi:deoxyribonuclease-1-like protein